MNSPKIATGTDSAIFFSGRLRAALNHLSAHFGQMRALDITTDRMRRYTASRQEEGAANATIQIELSILKRCFNLALQAELLPTKPYIPSVKVDNARQGFVTLEDFELIEAELPEPIRPLARFGFLTGWRAGEVFPLRWSQVDFEAGEVRLNPGDTKNGKGRSFPFHVLPPLADLLEAQRERTREIERDRGAIVPHVFHRDGKPIKSIRIAWESACERAGLPGILFHDLRRSAVRNLERAGVPRSVAMSLTGHLTESVYRRYAIVDSAAQAEGVEKLAKLHATPAKEPRKVVPMNRETA